jgi:hypothetical protein
MSTPEVNSPEFFGLSVGTPEYEQHQSGVVTDLGNTSETDFDFTPSVESIAFESVADLSPVESQRVRALIAANFSAKVAVQTVRYDRIG